MYMKISEVAKMLHISPSPIYAAIHAGRLEAIRIGRSFRISEEALNKYVQEYAVEEALDDDKP